MRGFSRRCKPQADEMAPIASECVAADDTRASGAVQMVKTSKATSKTKGLWAREARLSESDV